MPKTSSNRRTPPSIGCRRLEVISWLGIHALRPNQLPAASACRICSGVGYREISLFHRCSNPRKYTCAAPRCWPKSALGLPPSTNNESPTLISCNCSGNLSWHTPFHPDLRLCISGRCGCIWRCHLHLPDPRCSEKPTCCKFL